MYFLICITTVLANYNTQYVTDQLNIEHNNLDAQKTYLIQMIITQFPVDNYCLPLMQVQIDTQNYFDSQSYSIRSNIQSVLIKQTHNIIIEISCQVLDHFINIKDINKTMHFNITINEAVLLYFLSLYIDIVIKIFKFHKNKIIDQNIHQQYQNNRNLVNSLTMDRIVHFKCKKYKLIIQSLSMYSIIPGSMLMQYLIIKIMMYHTNNKKIIIQNKEKMFGISSIPADKINFTILPTFFTNFEILEQNQVEKSISLTRETDISDYIFIFGLFNFNLTHIQEITISFISLNDIHKFPYWATILLSSIFLFGILVAILIFISYKRQYRKLTQIQPALDRNILKKYMPTQRIDSKMIHQYKSTLLFIVYFIS